jgi:hypothetical protein
MLGRHINIIVAISMLKDTISTLKIASAMAIFFEMDEVRVTYPVGTVPSVAGHQAQPTDATSHIAYPQSAGSQVFCVEAYLFIYAKREVKKLRERHQKKYSTLRQISVILWKVISKAKPLHAERLDRDTYFTHARRVLQRLDDESLVTHAGEEKRHID